MRGLVFGLCLAQCALAQAQQPADLVTLGLPQFVAKRVQDVWVAPNGKALVYSTKTKAGLAVGAFNVATDEGAILFTLKPDEVFQQIEWLPSGTRFLVHTSMANSQGKLLTFGVGDVNQLQYKTMFTRQFGEADAAGMTFYTSPLLDHALVDLTTDKGHETWVLTQNATNFSFSRDIAAAEAQGQGYGGWTANGTAVYGGHGDMRGAQITFSESAFNLGKVENGTFTIELQPDAQSGVREALIKLSGRLITAAPAYQVGETVWECVPSNGALRSVKYPGPFITKESTMAPVFEYNLTQELRLGTTSVGTKSLWLVPGSQMVSQTSGEQTSETFKGEVKLPPVPKSGVLVSAQADRWWPSLDRSLIAFSWNGALFVRTVQRGSK